MEKKVLGTPALMRGLKEEGPGKEMGENNVREVQGHPEE